MKKFTAIAIALLLLVSIAGCAASKAGGEQSKNLTKEQCQNIALEHAGLTAEQVTWLRTEYDLDDLQPRYEVEFRHGDYEYDYAIHAETGKVLSWDKEYEPVTKPTAPDDPTTAPPAQTQPTEPTQAPPEKLTAEQAQTIALEHAGLTAEQVTRLQAEYELDDGVPEYSVEFYADGWEYDYEVHAETGKILQWDKDWD